MICRNCGSMVDEKAVVCVKCGLPPSSGVRFCQNCGAETGPNAAVCLKCGVALAAAPALGVQRVPVENPGAIAITSMILSLLSVMLCITALPGFIMGLIELKRISRGEAPQSGKPYALVGAIVGGIMTAITVLFVLFYLVIIIIAIATS